MPVPRPEWPWIVLGLRSHPSVRERLPRSGSSRSASAKHQRVHRLGLVALEPRAAETRCDIGIAAHGWDFHFPHDYCAGSSGLLMLSFTRSSLHSAARYRSDIAGREGCSGDRQDRRAYSRTLRSTSVPHARVKSGGPPPPSQRHFRSATMRCARRRSASEARRSRSPPPAIWAFQVAVVRPCERRVATSPRLGYALCDGTP
jgi:hypothetical protein